ncbi:hypothetical protein KM043_003678 [Ampulex compressa]|nr:hypothetical protein KM043_003678 [Ampulex compressa]
MLITRADLRGTGIVRILEYLEKGYFFPSAWSYCFPEPSVFRGLSECLERKERIRLAECRKGGRGRVNAYVCDARPQAFALGEEYLRNRAAKRQSEIRASGNNPEANSRALSRNFGMTRKRSRTLETLRPNSLAFPRIEINVYRDQSE